jgi:pilus assembly protein CpaB
VAAAALSFGDHIRPDKVRLVRWPEDAVPEGAYNKLDDLIGKGEDRVALQAIAPGEPILETKISGNGARATLSSIIGPNMRAVTLHVTDTTGVAGFVLPNDRVDVLLTRTQQENNPQTDILLQNLKVLAIDQVAQGANDKDRKDKPMLAKVVTVEVSPVDAEKLVLAQHVGTLSLALRNYASVNEVDTRGVSAKTLWPTPPSEPAKPTAAPAEPPPKPILVTVLHGARGTAEVGK